MPVKLFRKIDKYVIGFSIIIFFRLKYLFLNKGEKITKNPKKILVIRLWALGSSILTFPTIKQLEDYYGKNVQYDLLASTRNIGVYKNLGYFQNMYNLFNRKDLLKLIFSFKKYDIVIDMEEYFMVSAFMSLWLGKINVGFTNIKVRGLAYNQGIIYNDQEHSVLSELDLIKKLGIDYKLPEALEPMKYTQKDKEKVDEFLKGLSYSELICMHTGLAETSKDRAWPKERRIELIPQVLDKKVNCIILLSGSKGEYDAVQEIYDSLDKQYHKSIINICGLFNIFQFAYLLELCNLMISNDTGPMHLSACMGTKTIGLFGPNLPLRFGPYPEKDNVWLYKGNGEASINVHLGKFEEDKEYNIRKIKVEDVLKILTNY